MQRYFSALFFFVNSICSLVIAGGGNQNDANQLCQTLLQPMDIVNRSMTPEDAENFEKSVRKMQEVAVRRGWTIPKHRVSVVPGREMNILSESNGPIPPHPMEGIELVKRLQQGGGSALEFVTMGAAAGECSTCRSFFKSDLKLVKNIVIFNHVLGHIHHFGTSEFHKHAPSDVISASAELAEVLQKGYREVDHDTVALYYQHLLAFGIDAMDPRGIVQLPEELSLDQAQNRSHRSSYRSAREFQLGGMYRQAPEVEDSTGQQDLKWRATYSVLQAVTHFLPPHAEPWQRELVRLHELRKRIYPGNMQTQFKNEGWATFSMYHLARGTEWDRPESLIEFAQVIGGAALATNVQGWQPDPKLKHKPAFLLENPYFLGPLAWQRAFDRYLEKNPAVQNLSIDDQYLSFMNVEEPKTHHMNDDEFVEYGLDNEWWRKNPMFLARPATDEEVARARPAQIKGEGEKYYIVTSRDPKRMIRYWSRHIKRIHYRPRIAQIHPALAAGGILYQHDDFEQRPLSPVSLVQSLYSRGQIYNQPVRIKTWVSSLIFDDDKKAEEVPGQKISVPKSIPVTYEVNTKGIVTVESTELSAGQVRELAEFLTQQVEAYKMDMFQFYGGSVQEEEERKWGDLATKIVDYNMSRAANTSSFVSTAAGALHEVSRAMRQRLIKQMKDLASGKIKTGQGPNGTTTFSALPQTPFIGFDSRHIQAVYDQLPLSPLDHPSGQPADYDADDRTDVVFAVGKYLVGDLLPVKPPPGPPPPGKPQGDNELSQWEIPMEVFGEMLTREYGLANIRKTKGDIERIATTRRGGVHKPNGNLLWDRIAIEALSAENARQVAKGQPGLTAQTPSSERHNLARSILKEGMKNIAPSDYVVSGKMQVMQPNFGAVLVVGVDFTGSMLMPDERLRLAKKLTYNLHAVLGHLYDGKVKEEYFYFQQNATHSNLKQILGSFGGGSTSYPAAFDMAKEIFKAYPLEEYNHYFMMIGDGELISGDKEAQAIADRLEEMAQTTQYMGFAVTNEDQKSAGVLRVLEQAKVRNPWIGYSMIQSELQIPDAIKEMLPGEDYDPNRK